MEQLLTRSRKLILQVDSRIERSTVRQIDWNWRLNGIIGARGTGKTTLLLQRLKRLQSSGSKVFYVSLDDFYFTENRLYDLAVEFSRLGGEYLFVDEVHKYPSWAIEMKNIYDTLPGLKVSFSGSSITDLLRGDIDLSRRALFYELHGLSFREFLHFINGIMLPVCSIKDVLENHEEIAIDIVEKIRPLAHFADFLKHGYYPFFMEEFRDYALTLEQVIQLVVEIDLKYMKGFDPGKSRKLLQLLRVIASSAPFKPNISKLSTRIGIDRNTMISYFEYLEKARLIRRLHVAESDISVLQKPDKLLLNNTNLFYVLAPMTHEPGSIRETFFVSQVAATCEVFTHRRADFIVNHRWIIEVGGKNKSTHQIRGLDQNFLVLDDLEIGHGSKIPLWLFGFTY